MNNINAFQVFWTEPMRAKGKTDKGIISDFNFLTMILSVLEWKKNHSHKIKLYTDEFFYDYLKKIGLSKLLWDEYDTTTFNEINNINIVQFWSIGKFYAYMKEEAPCVSIDTDLILWDNIDNYFENSELCFSHWEKTDNSNIYLGKNELSRPKEYIFNPKWDWKLKAVNTSIIYFGNNSFKNYYTNEAIKFMLENTSNSTSFNELIFAEQKLLTMCAKEKGILNHSSAILDINWCPEKGVFEDNDGKLVDWKYYDLVNGNIITHTWVEKIWIEKDNDRRSKFCIEALNIIKSIDKSVYFCLVECDLIKNIKRKM